jgi:hypothetical protein
MTKRLRFTRPSSRTSLVLILAALAVLTLPLGAGASESDGLDTHPLDPPDVSSTDALNISIDSGVSWMTPPWSWRIPSSHSPTSIRPSRLGDVDEIVVAGQT